ncbi:MAG: helix-turn-helix domain-containing protein [Bacteroidales bacterium]|nr:helix-turn-helix domain-containing protein [Bacteroidales bacterium]
MKFAKASQKITALRDNNEFFLIFDRKRKDDFSYPLHFHAEFELNILIGAEGAIRKVGDSVEPIGALDFCLIGPNLNHQWERGACCDGTEVREITIQFLPSLIDNEMLDKEIFMPIRKMLLSASRGLAFSPEVASRMLPLVDELCSTRGFDSYLMIMRLLYDLATAPKPRALAGDTFRPEELCHTDSRVEQLYKYLKSNFHRCIRINEAASHVNTSTVTLSRIVKQCTGMSYVAFLNEIRLDNAKRMLMDSDMNISEICYSTGFNNVSNFNRFFKRKFGITPTEFRFSLAGRKRIV